MIRQAVLAFLYFIPPFVLADGYPKETPDTPFNTGTGSLSGAGDGLGGGYPPVSTDYESRYRGPVAMLMVLPDGHIAETAEVTAARATHLAALDKAKVLWTPAGAGGGSGGMGQGGSSAGGDGGYSYPQPGSNSLDGGSNTGSSAGGDGGYSYPQPGSNSLGGGSNSGKSYLSPQGASGGNSGSGHGTGSSAAAAGNVPYNGPLAMLMVLPDGHIADTPEVTAARAAHLAALDKAKALWAQSGAGMGHAGSSGASAGGIEGYNYPQPGSNSVEGGPSSQSYLPPQGGDGGSGQGQGGSSSAAAGSAPYSGPLAMLMVLPSGYLADTSDIAALRAAHLSALLKAQAAWKH